MVKTTVCKVCGKEIATSAKACPNCGAKIKKPIYKRVWFWLLILIIVGIIAGAGGGSDDPADKQDDSSTQVEQTDDTQEATTDEKKEEPKIEYTAYDVTELFDDINGNALAAEKKHQDEYVKITGYLGTIDSDGKYFCIEANPDDYDYMFQSIQVEITDESQIDHLMELSNGDKITIKGQITDIGEVLGYTVDLAKWVTK